jgi:hypothetical protein
MEGNTVRKYIKRKWWWINSLIFLNLFLSSFAKWIISLKMQNYSSWRPQQLIFKNWLSTVAHAGKLNNLSSRNWQDHGSRPATAKKVMRPPHLTSHQKWGVVMWACHPSYEERGNRSTAIQAGLGINTRPYLKNNKSKKVWRCGSSGSTCPGSASS